MSSSGVPSMRESLAEAVALGCSVDPVRRTGEVRVLCLVTGQRCVVNNRRKDSTRALLLMLRRVRANQEGLA